MTPVEWRVYSQARQPRRRRRNNSGINTLWFVFFLAVWVWWTSGSDKPKAQPKVPPSPVAIAAPPSPPSWSPSPTASSPTAVEEYNRSRASEWLNTQGEAGFTCQAAPKQQVCRDLRLAKPPIATRAGVPIKAK